MRPHAVALVMLATLPGAWAQNAWQLDDDSPRAPKAPAPAKPAEPATAAAKAAPPALSPNRILGRILFVDTAKGVVIVRLETPPGDREARLIARDADCTPRAVLAPVPVRRRTGETTAAYRVTHGAARVGQEIVGPGEKLLNLAAAKLPRVAKP